jgi:Fe-Mn family superoxide dismutase
MESIREYITLLEASNKRDTIEIVNLSYSDASLAPVITSDSMRFHYGKLAHAYAERYNTGEGDPDFNYAGAWLHNLYFTQFREPRTNNTANGPIGNLITSKFKNWDNFRDQFKQTAMTLQGSGWVYLARDGTIKLIHNHEVRDDILLLVDMWEHAFQPDYGTDKAKYLTNIWRIFDWNMCNTRYMAPYKK